MTRPIPNALTIAGSDSGGGAGIQADLKTFSALGAYGASVITALTAQNTRGVTGVHAPDAGFVSAQLDAVFDDIRIDAVKIGMLANAAIVRAVAAALTRHTPRHIVLDTVMISKSAHALLAPDAVDALRNELLPLADLVTPNLPEAAALLGVAAASAHAADLLDSVKQAGVLKIALEGTYPPFDYRNGDGQLEGFDVDVAKEVAARLGVKPQFVTTEWSGILAGLQAGKFDVIVNQVGITPARRQALDFSQPYVYSAAQLIQRADDKHDYGAPGALQGKRIGVTLGTNFADLAKTLQGVDVKTYPGAPEKLRDVAAGRIDVSMDDRLMLPYLIKNAHMPLRPGATINGGETQMGIPFRKGNPKFAKALDDALASMRADGTLKKISVHWFGVDTSVPSAQ